MINKLICWWSGHRISRKDYIHWLSVGRGKCSRCKQKICVKNSERKGYKLSK